MKDRNELLREAIEKGNALDVKTCLKNADVNDYKPDLIEPTPLFLAVSRNDISIVNLLMHHNANPNFKHVTNNHARTPLSQAVINNDENMIRAIVSHPEFTYGYNTGCAILEAMHLPDRSHLLPLLLEKHEGEAVKKCPVDAWAYGASNTAMWYATQRNDEASMALLVRHGAKKPYSLKEAIEKSLALTKALLDAGENPNQDYRTDDKHLPTPLFIAIKMGNLAIVQHLVNAGADMHYQRDIGNNSQTPVSFAIIEDQYEIFCWMVNHLAYEYTHRTGIAVLEAMWQKRPRYLPILLKKHVGAARFFSVDEWKYNEKDTAMMLALRNNDQESMKLLAGHGAVSVTLSDSSGKSTNDNSTPMTEKPVEPVVEKIKSAEELEKERKAKEKATHDQLLKTVLGTVMTEAVTSVVNQGADPNDPTTGLYGPEAGRTAFMYALDIGRMDHALAMLNSEKFTFKKEYPKVLGESLLKILKYGYTDKSKNKAIFDRVLNKPREEGIVIDDSVLKFTLENGYHECADKLIALRKEAIAAKTLTPTEEANQSLLYTCLRYNRITQAVALMDQGIDPNTPSTVYPYSNTAFMYALSLGHWDLVQAMLNTNNFGFKKDHPKVLGETIAKMLRATSHHSPSQTRDSLSKLIVNVLMKPRSIDINLNDWVEGDLDLLSLAVKMNAHGNVITALMEHGVSPYEEMPRKINSALTMALGAERHDTLLLMVSHSKFVYEFPKGERLLLKVLEKGYSTVANVLLGARKKALSKQAVPASSVLNDDLLRVSACYSRIDQMVELMNQGADPNHQASLENRLSHVKTPFIYALYNGQYGVMKAMIASDKFTFRKEQSKILGETISGLLKKLGQVQGYESETLINKMIVDVLRKPRDPEIILNDYVEDGYKLLWFAVKYNASSQVITVLMDQGVSPHGDEARKINPAISGHSLLRDALVLSIVTHRDFVYEFPSTENLLIQVLASDYMTIANELLAARKKALKAQTVPPASDLKNKLLRVSVVYNRIDQAIELMNQGADPNDPTTGFYETTYGKTAFSHALVNSKFVLASAMVKSDKFVFKKEYPKVFLQSLVTLLQTNRNEILPLLLEKYQDNGQPLEQSDGPNRNVLYLAYRNNWGADVLSRLMNFGFDPNALADNQKSTLSLVVLERGTTAAIPMIRHPKFEYKIPETEATLKLALANSQNEIVTALLEARERVFNREVIEKAKTLRLAIEKGELEEVTALLDQGHYPNYEIKGEAYPTPLWLAFALRKEAIIRLLIARGADLHFKKGSPSNSDSALLQFVVPYEPQEFVVEMINTAKFTFGEAAALALLRAAKEKRPSVIKALLEKHTGEPLYPLDKQMEQGTGKTALRLAVENDDVESVKLLLASKANPNLVNDRDACRTPLWVAVDHENEAMIDALLGAGANPNYAYQDVKGTIWSIFDYALSKDKKVGLEKLINAKVFKFDYAAVNGVMYSLMHGKMEIFNLILKKFTGDSKDLNQMRLVGTKDNALCVAVDRGNIDAVRSLIMHGASPTYYGNDFKDSPLVRAIKHDAIFNLMIPLGVVEFTPYCVEVIHECIAQNKPESAIALMDVHEMGSQIDLRATVREGKDIFHCAVMKDQWDLVDVLSNHGMKITAELIHECISLNLADKAIKLLNKYKPAPDLNSSLREGQTILHRAMANAMWDLVDVLRRHGMKFKVEIGQEGPVKLRDSATLKNFVDNGENKPNYERYLKSTQKMAITSKIYRLNDDPAENVVWDDRLLQKGCRFEL